MKRTTVRQLNELNHRFYNQVAVDFDRTRQYYWQGWTKLLPYFDELLATRKKISVLDLGCGNGRFGEFLAKTYPKVQIEYTGIDNNRTLLRFAGQRLAHQVHNLRLKSYDIVEKLLTQRRLGVLRSKQFDLIIAFGVFHHIPSLALRKKLLSILKKSLSPNGLLVTTFWRLMDDPRYQDRLVKPVKVGIKAKDLENNDCIIDWKPVPSAYRYCHHFTESEIGTLTTDSRTEVLANFPGDGKSAQLNQYVILRMHQVE